MILIVPMRNVRNKQEGLEYIKEEIYLNRIDHGLGTSVIKIPLRQCNFTQIIAAENSTRE